MKKDNRVAERIEAKRKWKMLTKKIKILTVLTASILGATLVYKGYKSFNNKVYLVNIENNKELSKYFGNIKKNAKLAALVGSRKTEAGTIYNAIVYNNDQMLGIYEIDGSLLKDQILETVNTGIYTLDDFDPSVAVNSINLRTNGRIGDNIITVIPEDSKIQTASKLIYSLLPKTWYRTLYYNGKELKTGYVHTDNIYRDTPDNRPYYVNVEKLNIREKPDPNSKVIKTLNIGTPIFLSNTNMKIVDGYQMEEVLYRDNLGNEIYGWVAAAKVNKFREALSHNIESTKYEENPGAFKVIDSKYHIETDSTDAKDLALRDIPSYNGNIIDYIYNGAMISSAKNNINIPIKNEEGEWSLVFYRNNWGYILKKHIKALDTNTYAIASSETGEIIYANGEEKQIPISNTIKILAALLSLKKCNDLNTPIKYSKNNIDICKGKNTTRYPNIVAKGKELTLKEVLQLMIINEDNPSLMALIDNLFESNDEFIKEANEYIRNLGCENTYISNLSGTTTISDYMIILKEAFNNEELIKIMETKKFKIGKETHKGYADILYKDSLYYNPNVEAATTSSNNKGHILSTISNVDNHKYITVSFSLDEDNNYKATTDLLEIPEIQKARRRAYIRKYADKILK